MARKKTHRIESELAVCDFLAIIDTTMKRNGIKRSALAKKLKCAPANITQIFKKNDLLISTMTELANALGLSISVEYVVERNKINFILEQRRNHLGQSHAVIYLSGDKPDN